jgi:hypothetical protein
MSRILWGYTNSNPYTNEDLYHPASEGRYLHDDINKWAREHMCLSTPLKEIPLRKKLWSLFSNHHMMPKLCTTIYDLAHSKREDLFPEWKEETDPITVAQAFWEAAYLFVFDRDYMLHPHNNKQVAGEDVVMKTPASKPSAKSTPPAKSVKKRKESVTKKTVNETPSLLLCL